MFYQYSFIHLFILYTDSLLHSSGTLEIYQQLQRENCGSHKAGLKYFKRRP